MAFRMTQQFSPYGTVAMVPVMQAPTYFVPTPLQGAFVTSAGPRGAATKRPMAAEKPPTTTVFVGNIHERCNNDLIRSMLQECGNVVSWKRIQGSNGKYQAFGFCEYDRPEATLRALRILHDFPLGEKRLVVKVDEKTRELLRGFVEKKRQAEGKPALNVDKEELPVDEEMKAQDPIYRSAVETLVRTQGGDLAKVEEGEIAPKSPTLHGKGGNLDIETLDREKKEYIAREISHFRETYKEDEKKENALVERASRARAQRSQSRRRSPDRDSREISIDRHSRSSHASRRPLDERRRRTRRSRSRSSSEEGESDTSSVRTASTHESRRKRPRRETRSRSRGYPSEDEEDKIERRRIERRLKDKETAYQQRLQKWEMREKKKAKEYEKYKEKLRAQRREEQREAKKLKEFLEDYDDERDDPKYYRSGALFQRRREYAKEQQEDAKDRAREKEELEEIRKKLLEEGHKNPDEELARIQKEQEETLLKKLRADSSEPPSPRRRAMKAAESGEVVEKEDGEESSSESDSEDSDSGSRRQEGLRLTTTTTTGIAGSDSDSASEDGEKKRRTKQKPTAEEVEEPDKESGVSTVSVLEEQPKMGFASLKFSASSSSLQSGAPAQPSVFGEEEESATEPGTFVAKKQLVPFKVTDQDRAETLTPEEKKQLIKALIEKIPTNKDQLFAFPINWEAVDKLLIEKRVRPWVNKKIVEYIGEEEQSLVDFICQKVQDKTAPKVILEDIGMVLDDEAEVFVVKMWRLLIYEIEAKKLGFVKSDG